MSQAPSMPKATAKWLVENTALSFKQIADFCHMHTVEIQGIADDEVAANVPPMSPIKRKILSAEEITRCEEDDTTSLEMLEQKTYGSKQKQTKYTPLARRQDKPDAISWLLKNVPGIKVSQIVKLVGTTKTTIEAVKTKTHWNSNNITPKDPVLLGLCTQGDLNKIADKVAKEQENNQAI